ncbi:MAG: type II secretion system F family protein [Candidatus Omnitrophica bacterium]|nr:type II secretion system F family protein [Candidatus Omnitrophota bacterium]MCM8799886.1 type II secretion system F family protein [Candidatus Omnitrophota bacterium]
MPYFFYIARDKSGKKITGSEDALSAEELASRLQARDLIVISIIAESKEAKFTLAESKSKFKRQHSRITSYDMVLLCQQLSTLLGAGVPIMQSLKIVSRQLASRRLTRVLLDLTSDMENGLSLHEAMAKHPRVFSELWVNLVESGEASGNLAQVLNRLADYLERNAEFQRKVISSLIYPAILIIVGIGALLFLTVKIIPTFANLFEGFNIKLPLITRAMILISKLIRSYFVWGILIGGILIFILRSYTKTNVGRKRLERFLFSLPLAGEFFRALIVERFSSGMATLIESGVPILYALEITERSVGNLTVAEIIRQIKEEVRGGKNLSLPMERSGFFEPMVVQMVAVGEEIGELSNMLKRINNFYHDYVDMFLARFTSLFEPLMLIFLGAIIGTMVVGMFLPLFQIAQLR